MKALRERGFEAEVVEEDEPHTEDAADIAADTTNTTAPTTLSISYPRSIISGGGIERLKRLLEAKGKLIQKALGVAHVPDAKRTSDAEHVCSAGYLPVEIDDEQISFPWFAIMPEPDEIAAYTKFLCVLCSFAENQKRITCKAIEPENEKYAFRCFLLRLGFIGSSAELKQTRRILLSRLSGSSAFRQPKVNDTGHDESSSNTVLENTVTEE